MDQRSDPTLLSIRVLIVSPDKPANQKARQGRVILVSPLGNQNIAHFDAGTKCGIITPVMGMIGFDGAG